MKLYQQTRKQKLNKAQIPTSQASQVKGLEGIDAILSRLYPSKNEGDPRQGKFTLASLASTTVAGEGSGFGKFTPASANEGVEE
jgi:hypothetical protein